jgi:hypothetical protein
LSVSLYLIVTCRLNIKFKNCPFALFSVWAAWDNSEVPVFWVWRALLSL